MESVFKPWDASLSSSPETTTNHIEQKKIPNKSFYPWNDTTKNTFGRTSWGRVTPASSVRRASSLMTDNDDTFGRVIICDVSLGFGYPFSSLRGSQTGRAVFGVLRVALMARGGSRSDAGGPFWAVASRGTCVAVHRVRIWKKRTKNVLIWQIRAPWSRITATNPQKSLSLCGNYAKAKVSFFEELNIS